MRLCLGRLGFNRFLRAENLTDWVYLCLDRHVANHHLNDINAIYAYEDGAALSFEAAKKQGILCFYDLPILYYKMSHSIQADEAERFPELAISMKATDEPDWKIERKQKEIQLADHIFVASSITRHSLVAEGIDTNKITVVPYGAPVDYFRPGSKADNIFRALFVGHLGGRKGVHYLLSAWKDLKLPNSELMLVGPNLLPAQWLSQYESHFTHIPPVPHSTLNRYFTHASVFVFPSLVEGFGLVLLEAMACGIPVITTPNTAGPDIITDGVEGFIVPIRDVDALKQKLEWCYTHPDELLQMGIAARLRAEQLTWKRYREQLSSQVYNFLHNQH